MKLVYLANSTIPSRTANSIHVMKMGQALGDLGHDVTLIVPAVAHGAEEGADDVWSFYGVRRNFKIIWQKSPLSFRPLKAFLQARRALSLKPDLVYGRDFPAVTVAALLGARVMLERHEPSRSLAERLILQILLLLPRFGGVVVISRRLRAWYEENFSRLRGRIIVAPDGADPVPAETKPVALPRKGSFNAGYTGNLFSGKGVEMIFKLAPLCPEETFHIVGGGPEEIRRWTAQPDAPPNVIFHGFQPQAAVPSWLAAFDIVLAPYQATVYGHGRQNNLADWMSPLKIFEYMAAGKAIICSDLPVLREVLEDGTTALLCPPDDAAAWQAALERLRSDPALALRLGQAAQKRFLDNYTWAARAAHIFENFDWKK